MVTILDSMENEKKFYSLTAVTRKINQLLEPAYAQRFWIKAEISSGRERNGAFYCNLVETNLNGTIVAQVRCNIWSKVLTDIKRKFKDQGLDLVLDDGTVIGIEVSIDFHPVYGITLKVYDADPAVALGEMELKKRQVIEKLQKEGLFEKNKKLYLTKLPKRIGLISANDSAAYSDFLATIKNSGYGFELLIADAMMQGNQTQDSVINAIIGLEKLKPDLIVILRGGGSKSDLYSLDNELIARRIAEAIIPIWTGIGHEIDMSVLDYVSHKNFKTPTAVAEELVNRYNNMELILENAKSRIISSWNNRLKTEKDFISNAQNGIIQGTRKLVQFCGEKIKNIANKLSIKINNRFSTCKTYLDKAKHTLQSESLAILQKQKIEGKNQVGRFKKSVNYQIRDKHKELDILKKRFNPDYVLRIINIENKQLESKQSIIKATDPKNSLKRGYSLIYDDQNKLLKSVSEVKSGQTIKVQVYDGNIISTVDKTEVKDNDRE